MALIPYLIKDISGKTSVPNEGEFRPYKVVLEIQNKEASAAFHDNVAIKLPNGHSQFIGEIFSRSAFSRYDSRYPLVTSGIIEVSKDE